LEKNYWVFLWCSRYLTQCYLVRQLLSTRTTKI
jgi:hypothetical protein